MSFRSQVEEQSKFLELLFSEAESAHTVFKKEWDKGTKDQHFSEYKKTEIYNKTLKDFWNTFQKIDLVANTIIKELKDKDTAQLDKAFAYLQVKKHHHRSGYNKEKICRALKKIELNKDQKDVLQEIILEQMDYAQREFKELMHLIPRIITPGFEKKIRNFNAKGNPYVEKRLEDILNNYF